MRMLVLGAPGPYPERLSSFIEDGHEVCFVPTQGGPPPCVEGLQLVHMHELRADKAAGKAGDAGLIEGLLQFVEGGRFDVIYSLLNVWDGSTQVTAALLRLGCTVPVVRHYKEHYMWPWDDEQITMERAAGVIFINEESRRHFGKLYTLPPRTVVYDADLIPRRYLAGELQTKLSALDGSPHLLIAGTATDDGGRYDYRELICRLADAHAHVHLYGQFKRMQGNGELHEQPEVEAIYRDLPVGGYLHVHRAIQPEQFAGEWSCYDAGLLHAPRHDDRFRLLNMPNRYSAYLAAGLPVALPRGEMPAMQRHLEAMNAAIIYDEPGELVHRLPDPHAAEAALQARHASTFEAVYPGIIAFIRSCLE